METSKLQPLQWDLLRAFFRIDNRFFLSGGAALSGFYLGHRETHDLDLFTPEDILDEGTSELETIARELGATFERIQTSPDFHRVLVRRDHEAVIVDLVRDRVAQVAGEKRTIGGIRVDPPEEILANKLCALLSRAEVRDLVDVRALELAGHSIESAISAAAQKDAGLTPGQLSWVLSQITLGEDLVPPGGLSRNDLLQYLSDLIDRLARLAFPDPK